MSGDESCSDYIQAASCVEGEYLGQNGEVVKVVNTEPVSQTEVLDDLTMRFLLNIPEEDLCSLVCVLIIWCLCM